MINYCDSDNAAYYHDSNSTICGEVLTGNFGGQVALSYAYSEVNALIFRLWYQLACIECVNMYL